MHMIDFIRNRITNRLKMKFQHIKCHNQGRFKRKNCSVIFTGDSEFNVNKGLCNKVVLNFER